MILGAEFAHFHSVSNLALDFLLGLNHPKIIVLFAKYELSNATCLQDSLNL